jgi:hypothetical protein
VHANENSWPLREKFTIWSFTETGKATWAPRFEWPWRAALGCSRTSTWCSVSSRLGHPGRGVWHVRELYNLFANNSNSYGSHTVIPQKVWHKGCRYLRCLVHAVHWKLGPIWAARQSVEKPRCFQPQDPSKAQPAGQLKVLAAHSQQGTRLDQVCVAMTYCVLS